MRDFSSENIQVAANTSRREQRLVLRFLLPFLFHRSFLAAHLSRSEEPLLSGRGGGWTKVRAIQFGEVLVQAELAFEQAEHRAVLIGKLSFPAKPAAKPGIVQFTRTDRTDSAENT